MAQEQSELVNNKGEVFPIVFWCLPKRMKPSNGKDPLCMMLVLMCSVTCQGCVQAPGGILLFSQNVDTNELNLRGFEYYLCHP